MPFANVFLFWSFYQFLILAPYWQVNVVKNDIVKLFDIIEKYGMCSFAFASFKVISADVYF